MLLVLVLAAAGVAEENCEGRLIFSHQDWKGIPAAEIKCCAQNMAIISSGMQMQAVRQEGDEWVTASGVVPLIAKPTAVSVIQSGYVFVLYGSGDPESFPLDVWFLSSAGSFSPLFPRKKYVDMNGCTGLTTYQSGTGVIEMYFTFKNRVSKLLFNPEDNVITAPWAVAVETTETVTRTPAGLLLITREYCLEVRDPESGKVLTKVDKVKHGSFSAGCTTSILEMLPDTKTDSQVWVALDWADPRSPVELWRKFIWYPFSAVLLITGNLVHVMGSVPETERVWEMRTGEEVAFFVSETQQSCRVSAFVFNGFVFCIEPGQVIIRFSIESCHGAAQSNAPSTLLPAPPPETTPVIIEEPKELPPLFFHIPLAAAVICCVIFCCVHRWRARESYDDRATYVGMAHAASASPADRTWSL